MAFSSGTFSLYTPGNPVVTGTTISSTWANNTLNDIATGLSTCLLKDGTQTVTANIPMNSFKFTGLAAGTAAGNSLRYEQLWNGSNLTIAATQANQETGTSNAVAVTPGVQQYHPSASKCWASYAATTNSVLSSYNMTSVSDNGSGTNTFTIATDMSAANQCFVASSYDNGSAAASLAIFSGTVDAGVVTVITINPTSAVAADSAYVSLVGYGDQA